MTTPPLLPVQPFQEKPNVSYCGPASLKMVLKYYGVEKTEDELAAMLGTTLEDGTSGEALQRVASELGFQTTVKDYSSYEDIQQWLDKKVPVIVDWFSSTPTGDQADGHYSIVVGLDEKFIYLQDPEIGKLRKLTRAEFLRVWFDFTQDYIHSPNEIVIRWLLAIYRE